MSPPNDGRVLVRALAKFADEHGLALEHHCHDWVFRLSDKNGERSALIVGYDLGLNAGATVQVCRDKTAAYELLSGAGLPAVEHRLVIQPGRAEFAPGASATAVIKPFFLQAGGQVVVKPNEGTSGQGVVLCETLDEIRAAVDALHATNDAAALSPFLNIERERRIYVLGGMAVVATDKVLPFVIGDGRSSVETLALRQLGAGTTAALKCLAPDTSERWSAMGVPDEGDAVRLNWRHNLGQGAGAHLLETIPEADADLAIRAAKSLGLVAGSVDLVLVDGQTIILEVNAGVMMEHLATQSPRGAELAESYYHAAFELLWNRAASS